MQAEMESKFAIEKAIDRKQNDDDLFGSEARVVYYLLKTLKQTEKEIGIRFDATRLDLSTWGESRGVCRTTLFLNRCTIESNILVQEIVYLCALLSSPFFIVCLSCLSKLLALSCWRQKRTVSLLSVFMLSQIGVSRWLKDSSGACLVKTPFTSHTMRLCAHFFLLAAITLNIFSLRTTARF